MRKIILTLLFLIPLVLYAQKGHFNDNVTWSLQSDGTLYVEGSGTIEGIKKAKNSILVKKKVANKVVTLDLSRFSGNVGKYVFCGLSNLKAIIVDNSATYKFDAESFDPDAKIESLEFISNNFTNKDYRVYFNYYQSLENNKCNFSYRCNTINRTLAIRNLHTQMDSVINKSNYTGKGIKVWNDTANGIRIYYGDWEHGEIQGHGIAVMFNGTVKIGLWKDNVYIGHPEEITMQEFLAFPEILPLNLIAKNLVEKAVNKWQQKDEYESIEEWQLRVNEVSRKERAIVEYNLLVDKYIENAASKTSINLKLGNFDADNGTYIVSDDTFGKMPVAITNKITPQQFRSSWNSIVKVPTYFFNGKSISICDITFWQGKNMVAYYRNDAKLQYNTAPVDYNFNPIEIPWIDNSKRYVVVPSDVDVSIPVTNRKNDSTFLFVVANENYKNAQIVPFALNDGLIFALYGEKTLGIPKDHIKVYKDATYGQLLECIASIKQVAEGYDGHVKILFYYAGHAFPDEIGNNTFLLPTDGNPKLPATAYGMHNLYSELGSINANPITCFIDACFSGSTRQNNMLLASRGVVIKVKSEIPHGNVIVFTSSSEYETSLMYQEKSHGLFTYFLLKKLKESKGSLEMGDLVDYVTREVKRSSAVVNQKLQTPQVLVSPNMTQPWRKINL